MVFEILAVAASVAAVYEYFTNKSFKAKVTLLVQDTQKELATVKSKAASGVAVVESDFEKAEAAVKALVAKL